MASVPIRDLPSFEGFARIASEVAGLDEGADLHELLRGVAALDLCLEGETPKAYVEPGAGHDRVLPQGTGRVAHPSLVFAAARAYSEGRDEVDFFPDECLTDGRPSEPSGAAWRDALAAEAAARLGARTFRLPDGSTLYVAFRGWWLVAVMARARDGAPSLAVRNVWPERWPLAEGSLTLLRVGVGGDPFGRLSSEGSDVLRRLALTDLRRLDAARALDAWESGAAPYGSVPYVDRYSPYPTAPAALVACLLGLTDGRRARSDPARGWAIAPYDVDCLDPDWPPTAASASVAYRTAARALDGPALGVATALCLPGEEDPVVLSALLRFVALSRRPDRLGAALARRPALRAFVRQSALRPMTIVDRFPTAATNDLLLSLGDGADPDCVVAALLEAIHGTPVCPAVARSVSTPGIAALTIPAKDRLPYPVGRLVGSLRDELAPWHLQAVLGRGSRRRALAPAEVAAFARSVDGVFASCRDGSRSAGLARSTWALRRVFDACASTGGVLVGVPDGFADVVRWFGDMAVRAGATDRLAATISTLFPMGRTASSLERVDRAWHRDVTGRNARVGAWYATLPPEVTGVDPDALFPPLAGFPIPANLAVRRLASHADCEAEGRRMSHCVATYGDAAARGDCLLFSVVAGDRSRSTVEMRVLDGPPAVLVASQVKAFRNREAGTAHFRFAGGLAEWFNARVDPDAAASFLSARARADACVRAMATAEADLPADLRATLAERAFEALKPYLSPSLRRGTREAWLAHLTTVRTDPR